MQIKILVTQRLCILVIFDLEKIVKEFFEKNLLFIL